jgi:hypothetical protein
MTYNTTGKYFLEEGQVYTECYIAGTYKFWNTSFTKMFMLMFTVDKRATTYFHMLRAGEIYVSHWSSPTAKYWTMFINQLLAHFKQI